MKTPILLFLIGGTLVGAALTLAFVGGEKQRSEDSSKTNEIGHQGHGDTSAAAANTERDRAFIEMMIPHHEEAVASARVVLRQGGTTPEVRDLAQAIILAQEEEIAQMRRWHNSWYQTEFEDTGVYTPMMRDLSSLQGNALDQVFLEDMVEHHLHAITMAHDIAKTTKRPELQQLSQAIAETQSNEIVTIKTLLKSFGTSTPATL
jgi:uncharacterized protein (DUF305 family)